MYPFSVNSTRESRKPLFSHFFICYFKSIIKPQYLIMEIIDNFQLFGLSKYLGCLNPLVAQMVKHLPTMRKTWFDPWVGKIPWKRKWQPTLVLLPGKSHGWRSLVGYSPWGHKEWDMTERPHFHFLFKYSGYSDSQVIFSSHLTITPLNYLYVCIFISSVLMPLSRLFD